MISLIAFFTLIASAVADDYLNDQLYIAIDNCNLNQMQDALKEGADSNTILSENTLSLFKYKVQVSEGHTPLDRSALFKKFETFMPIAPEEAFFKFLHSYLNFEADFMPLTQIMASSKELLIEFISWSKSINFAYPYSKRVEDITTFIEENRDLLQKNLQLNTKEQEYIFSK